MRNKKGFTLVEIMIVVAIIALLAAIAIPNLLRARLQANESAAQGAVKTIAAAEVSYRSANPEYGDLEALGGANPPYIDATLRQGTKQGYTFNVGDITAETFVATAQPTNQGTSGVRSFCATEDGVVRVQATGGAIAGRDACLGLQPTN
jgi:prepilin-type N-terminal cleavage/methylation domain-containing protein